MNEQPIETTPQEGTTVTEDSSEPVDPIDAELSTLREKMDSQNNKAKQKITEMGQDRADLKAQLESQQAEIDNLRRGGYADNQPQEEDVYQRAVREIAHEIVELKTQQAQRDEAQAVDSRITKLQQQFGVSVEDAQLIHDYNTQGDFESAYKVANLNSQRNQRKQNQAQQRASAGAPLPQARSNTSSPPQVSEGDLREKLAKMSPTERASAVAVNPDLLQYC